jgi:hypothetical protein
MFRPSRSRRRTIKENALNASELALQLAQDQKFRKRLVSAIKHSSEAGSRTRRGLGLRGAVARLASDQALQSELRRARTDLQKAFSQVEAKRRRRKLSKLTLLTALGSLAAVPQLRQGVRRMIRNAPKPSASLTDIANGLRATGSGSDGARPGSLEDLTRDELYERAQQAGIPGRSEMSKQQLVDALRAKS